jgi:fructose-1,6-bisphosphatase/inositol monophosphatase family enzyme
MDEYLKFAQDLARQAGQLIKDNFEKNLAVEIKPDNSPVTEVDKAINELVSEAVKETYSEHGLLGEEENYGTGQEEFQWLCDPLDGTKAFILGVPVNTFILGLTKQGQILLSVIYHPFTDRLYHAVKGHGAFCNQERLHVSNQTLKQGGYVSLGEYSFGFVDGLRAAGAQIDFIPGAGYRAMIVASGRLAGIMQIPSNTDFHDVGPASLIVEEAGGKVTDLAGKSLRFDGPLKNGIILSNSAAHDELLAIARG